MSRLKTFTIASLVLLLAGCSDVFRPSYDYANVVVTALDQEGQPVPAVRLTLYNGPQHLEYGLTGRNGRYDFRFVPAGVYGVAAGVPEGYAFPDNVPPYRLLQVEKGGRVEIEFVLREVM